MYCSKCGKPNDDMATFCSSCGNILRHAQTPPMEVPGRNPSPPPMSVSGVSASNPYKAEFALGLTGAIIGSIIFFILFMVSVAELSGELYADYYYTEGMVTITSVFCLASFILGYIGIAKINKRNLNGGIPLLVGAGLGFIAMFFSPTSFITVFYWPLLLAGGITALARKASLKKTGNYPL